LVTAVKLSGASFSSEKSRSISQQSEAVHRRTHTQRRKLAVQAILSHNTPHSYSKVDSASHRSSKPVIHRSFVHKPLHSVYIHKSSERRTTYLSRQIAVLVPKPSVRRIHTFAVNRRTRKHKPAISRNPFALQTSTQTRRTRKSPGLSVKDKSANGPDSRKTAANVRPKRLVSPVECASTASTVRHHAPVTPHTKPN
jgi:hypothetical protein